MIRHDIYFDCLDVVNDLLFFLFLFFFFFFFKQKTAYEILSGLVGSEVCIRGRLRFQRCIRVTLRRGQTVHDGLKGFNNPLTGFSSGPLYTSDAADE